MEVKNKTLRRDVETMENVIFVCFGKPRGNELPQVATEEQILLDLLREQSIHPDRGAAADILTNIKD